MLILKYEKGRVQGKRAGGNTLLNQTRQITDHCSDHCSGITMSGTNS